jgi:hypothetical protein
VDPKTQWRHKSKLKELAKIERGILKSVRRAQRQADLIVPKALAWIPIPYEKPEPITAVILARRAWYEAGEVRTIPVTTLCRAIALNEAQRLLKREGFTHCTVLDVYEGHPACNQLHQDLCRWRAVNPRPIVESHSSHPQGDSKHEHRSP